MKRIYIEITNHCNLSCSFCIQKHETARFLTCQQFEEILKQVKPFTSYIYLHILGEPLLHPELEEILSLCSTYQMHVQITTNGTLLKKQLPLLLKYPIRQINVSVHSFKHQQEDYLNTVLQTCDLLSENTYISYRLWCKQNGQFDEKATKIYQKILEHYHHPDLSHTNSLAPNRFLSKDEVFEWPDLKHPFISSCGTCRSIKDSIGILSNGNVVPCCLDAYGQATLGNIFETPLFEILSNELTKSMLKGFQENQLKSELCQRCQYRTRFK